MYTCWLSLYAASDDLIVIVTKVATSLHNHLCSILLFLLLLPFFPFGYPWARARHVFVRVHWCAVNIDRGGFVLLLVRRRHNDGRFGEVSNIYMWWLSFLGLNWTNNDMIISSFKRLVLLDFRYPHLIHGINLVSSYGSWNTGSITRLSVQIVLNQKIKL